MKKFLIRLLIDSLESIVTLAVDEVVAELEQNPKITDNERTALNSVGLIIKQRVGLRLRSF